MIGKNTSSILDSAIELLKWPVALFVVFLTIPAFKADAYLISRMFSNSELLWQFFLPMAVIIFFFLIVPSLAGSFFAITEHELTHMLFAVLTFHKPKGLDVNQDVGGSFSFIGRGNWLIAIAPYFFPTFLAFIMIATPVYTHFQPLPAFYLPLLGIFIGYNFITTLLSVHPKQTDFQVVGFPFTICFVPGSNLLKYGFLFAYVLKGSEGFSLYTKLLIQTTTTWLGVFL